MVPKKMEHQGERKAVMEKQICPVWLENKSLLRNCGMSERTEPLSKRDQQIHSVVLE
jgi:hypothetical protein